ncbi:hypothetical protein CCY99_02860 [Helicobacter sp. 16-1353]|uniref:hypothetical protein n=1 Tax=Helicobacter sp. 16-1353 TaxID=2004996 RepID=UPI000DCB1B44|nr:hypothetical protein [Helicobacter sp. 16-1353]RAX54716.1 hypothetical protein CCY99_02860 [Helicobacter sp. 16-1353]
MKKKLVFTIFFIIFAIGIFLFTANEYLKRIEQNAIETYLYSIKNESLEYALNIEINPVVCKGFIRHQCNISNIKIYDNKIEISLQNASAKIIDISHDSIEVAFHIDEITYNSHTNLALLPRKFTYTLNLQKQDSRLGYVLLNRSIYLDFNTFDININLDILLREEIFRNKSILFLLKEWFDNTTPSFYEYSLDTLKININSKKIKNESHNPSISLKSIIDKYQQENPLFHNDFANHYFNEFIKDTYRLLDNKIDTLDLSIKRKNQNLVFFNLLSDEASKKKILEIIQVLNSINETYKIDLQTR